MLLLKRCARRPIQITVPFVWELCLIPSACQALCLFVHIDITVRYRNTQIYV